MLKVFKDEGNQFLLVMGTCLFLAVFLLVATVLVSDAEIIAPPEPLITSYFSPNGGCQAAIIREIESATSTVYVQAFQFSNVLITAALISAHKQGIKVEVVIDRSQSKATGTTIRSVFNAGIPTYTDSRHTSAHNKVMIIDGDCLITGSMNFTYNGEAKNAENIVIIKNEPDLIQRYTNNFLVHKGHSDKYK